MDPSERRRRRDPNYNPMFDDPEYRKETASGEEAPSESEDSEEYEYEYEEEGDDMSSNGVMSAVGGALASGAKQAAAAQVNDMLTQQATKMLVSAGVLNKDAENNMAVQLGLKALLPVLILWMSEKFPEQIPQSALVGEGAKLALTSASAEVIQPAMMMMTPMLKQLAGAAQEQRKLDQAEPGDSAGDSKDGEINVTQVG